MAEIPLIGQNSSMWIALARLTDALLGAVAMVALGVLSRPQAYHAIDWDTIIFLMGMMILVGYLSLGGFFELIEVYVVRWAHTPRRLLIALVFTSSLLSAFLLNDTVCLMLTPFLVTVIERRNLLLFFAGLFVVMRGVEVSGWVDSLMQPFKGLIGPRGGTWI